MVISTKKWGFFKLLYFHIGDYSTTFEVLVFYQLCHLFLVILVLSLAIPGLSLAIPGLSLLILSQFQDVTDSSCLAFYQQYITRYNNLNLLGTMI